jgi:hypothetical protein
MVGGSAFEQFLATPIAALGQTFGIDVLKRWIVGFDPFS